MKIKLFALVLISAVALVASLAFAEAGGGQQSDPAMQQEGQAAEPKDEGAAPGGQAMSSDTIKQAQEALNSKGYDAGPADGKLGSKTQDAVKNFQKDQGMEASGKLDQQTLAALGISSEGAAAGGGEKEGEAGKSEGMDSGAGAGGQSSEPGSTESQ